MTELNETDEVRVDVPLRDYGDRWVFPGDRLFVKRASGNRALVYCPSSGTHAWLWTRDLHPPVAAVDPRSLYERIEHLERRVAELEDRAILGDDPEVDEALTDDVMENAAEDLAEMAADGLGVASWRDNPYSLPPAVREGVECPTCSNQGGQFGGARVYNVTRHEDQAAVDECVRRQDAMGGGPGVYRHL